MHDTLTKQYITLQHIGCAKRQATSKKGIVMKKLYFIAQLEKTVYVDPVFLNAAGQIDTDECTLFETLKNKYPEFKFVKKDLNKSTKRTYSNLTYDRMKAFINTCLPEDARKDALAKFEQICDESTSKDGRYGYVKSWFLSQYKAQYNKSSFAKEKNESTHTASTEAEEKEAAQNG